MISILLVLVGFYISISILRMFYTKRIYFAGLSMIDQTLTTCYNFPQGRILNSLAFAGEKQKCGGDSYDKE